MATSARRTINARDVVSSALPNAGSVTYSVTAPLTAREPIGRFISCFARGSTPCFSPSAPPFAPSYFSPYPSFSFFSSISLSLSFSFSFFLFLYALRLSPDITSLLLLLIF